MLTKVEKHTSVSLHPENFLVIEKNKRKHPKHENVTSQNLAPNHES